MNTNTIELNKKIESCILMHEKLAKKTMAIASESKAPEYASGFSDGYEAAITDFLHVLMKKKSLDEHFFGSAYEHL